MRNIQVKALYCSGCHSFLGAPFGVSAVCRGSVGTSHEPTTMVWVNVAKVNHDQIDYGGMAWDIYDAIALVSSNNIDLGMDAIEQHLPAFIEACLATQAELDKKDTQDA